MKDKYIVCIQGPTATGKTDLAIFLAKHFKSEIISADSRQFYREMTIGTAKPSAQQLQQVRHHFIDFLSVTDRYSAYDFEQQSLELVKNMHQDGMLPIFVGGSGLYMDAVIKGFNNIPDVDPALRKSLTDELQLVGMNQMLKKLKELDPAYYERVDRANPRRVLRALEVSITTGIAYSSFLNPEKSERPFKSIRIGISYPLDTLYSLIDKRCDTMLENGLVNEVESLLHYKSLSPLQTIGYREFFDYFEQKTSLDFAIEKFKQHTRNFARKQITWLRRDKDITWFIPPEKNQVLDYILNCLF